MTCKNSIPSWGGHPAFTAKLYLGINKGQKQNVWIKLRIETKNRGVDTALGVVREVFVDILILYFTRPLQNELEFIVTAVTSC